MVVENTDRRHVNHSSDNVRETLRYQRNLRETSFHLRLFSRFGGTGYASQ